MNAVFGGYLHKSRLICNLSPSLPCSEGMFWGMWLLGRSANNDGGNFQKIYPNCKVLYFQKQHLESVLFPSLRRYFPKRSVHEGFLLNRCPWPRTTRGRQVAVKEALPALCAQKVCPPPISITRGPHPPAVCLVLASSFAIEWVTLHLAFCEIEPKSPLGLLTSACLCGLPLLLGFSAAFCAAFSIPFSSPDPSLPSQGRRQPTMVEWQWMLVL